MSNELLQKAIKLLNIRDVYLRSTNLTLAKDFDPKLPNQTFDVQIGVNVINGHIVVYHNDKHEETGRLFRVNVDAGIRYIRPEEKQSESEQIPVEADKNVKVELAATFIAEYDLADKNLDHEALNVFALQNAGLHVWPYWREYLQSTLVRARLPIVVIPMYSSGLVNANLREQRQE